MFWENDRGPVGARSFVFYLVGLTCERELILALNNYKSEKRKNYDSD